MAEETVLVTGASSGIGRELAHLFAAGGSRPILTARRADRLEELAAELRERHRAEPIVLPADLAERGAPRAIFERLAADGIRVDVLVNDAGFGLLGAFAELSLERQLEMIEVNVVALAHLARLFLPGMLERRRGGILNVASTAAFQPGPRMAVYYATKAFVLSFTEAVFEEAAGTGVRVTCLCPGPTATEFGDLSGLGAKAIFRRNVMGAADVARAGYRGFRRGKALVVPGAFNRLAAFSVRLSPRSIVRKMVRRLQS